VNEQNDGGEAGVVSGAMLRRVVRTQPKTVLIEERIVDVAGCLPLARAAEIQGVENVVQRLMEENIIAPNGLPYLHYLEWGYFVLGEGAEILLTPLGLSWFGKRCGKGRH